MKIKSIFKNEIFQAGAICFMIAFLSLIYFVIKGHGFFTLTNDFNDQQIPFSMGLHQAILDSGIGGFSWDIDLGTSTINGFGFYELGSPFFWLTMLFPAKVFPYIVAWVFMIKYACAGVTSYLYLRRFVENTKWAVVGAVMYAFSGYSIMNMLYYHFHEVIVFFPLMLLGLEIFKEKNDKRLFIFAVFLNCLVNYYFFICEVVFLVVYYLFRFASKDIKLLLKDALQCVGCGIVGAGMACFMFVPNLIFVAGNPRTDNEYTLLKLFTTTLQEYMYILKGLLLPAEAMTEISACYPMHFNSHGSYIPLVGLCLVIAYIIKKRDRLAGLITFLLIGSFLPIVSEGFFLFTSSQMRWWFMMILMMVLASIRMLEKPDKKAIIWGSCINGALVAGLYITLNILNSKAVLDMQWIFHNKRLVMLSLVPIIGIILTCLVVFVFKCNYRFIVFGVSAFAVILCAYTVHIYRANERWMTAEQYKALCEASVQIKLPDSQYRLNDTYNLTAMGAHVPGFSDQSSTDTNSIRDFEDLFDYYHECAAINKNQYPGLHELLAGKYYLAYDENAGNVVDTYETSGDTVYLMEGSACPIGFAVDSYILEDELRSIPIEQRAIALLDSAVLKEDQVTDEIKSALREKKADDITFDRTPEGYVEQKTACAVGNFELDGKGIRCTTDYADNTYVYFSVPSDDGWTARVDGEKTPIIVTGGMMMIKVPAGNHDVVLSYVTPWFIPGLVVAVVCLMIYVAYWIYYCKKCKAVTLE